MQNLKKVLIVIDPKGNIVIRLKGLKCLLGLEHDLREQEEDDPDPNRFRPRWGTREE